MHDWIYQLTLAPVMNSSLSVGRISVFALSISTSAYYPNNAHPQAYATITYLNVQYIFSLYSNVIAKY